MANGQMVQMLLHTDVVKYLEFKAVDGSFVVRDRRVHKVPSNDREALSSSLMGLLEKYRAKSFFVFVQDYQPNDPATWKGLGDLSRRSMRSLFDHFGLAETTIDFVGHALALQQSDGYLDAPALPTVMAVKLYADSIARFGGGSPYIYPLYGLGELPQAFARLSAVYGGTYMLNKPDCAPVFDSSGRVCGVSSAGETAKAPIVVGDPSYFPGKTRLTMRVALALCILSHPIPGTADAASAQIIIPYKQLPGRSTDMYVFCTSSTHSVVAKGKWAAFVSCRLEGSAERVKEELGPGLALLGPIEHAFFDVSDVHEPLADGRGDGCFVSRGYDETSHFEGLTADVMALYTRITGKTLALDRAGLAKAHGEAA
jgi:Rab GDP dissociation inhibitor